MRRRGSAILIVLILMSVMIPLTMGYLSLDVMLAQNNTRYEDSQVAEMATQAGVNDVKRQISVDLQDVNPSEIAFLADNSGYMVEVDSNTKTSGAVDVNSLKRNKKYYGVWRDDDEGASKFNFVITGYYAGIKHAYRVSVPMPSGGVSETLLAKGSSFAPGSSSNIYYDDPSNTLYAYGDPSLQIFDLSNKNMPIFKGKADIGNNRWRMILVGSYLYVVDSESLDVNGSLHVINVSNPESITEVGSISLGKDPAYPAVYQNAAGGLWISRDETGRYLYVAGFYRGSNSTVSCGSETGIYCGKDELIVFDISNAESPVMTSRISLGDWYTIPGSGLSPFIQKVRSYTIAGQTYAYVSDGPRGLIIVNVTNPSSPAVSSVTSVPWTILTDNTGLGLPSGNMWIKDAVLFEGHAYLMAGNGGVQVINVADPSNPDLLENNGICASIESEWDTFALAANQRRIYTANTYLWQAGIYAFDVDTPGMPRRYGDATMQCSPGYATGLPPQDEPIVVVTTRIGPVYYDSEQFLIGRHTYELFNVFDAIPSPTNPTFLDLIGGAPVIGDLFDMKLSKKEADGKEHYAYLGTTNGIKVMDFTDTSKPKILGNSSFNAWGSFGAVQLKIAIDEQNNYLYRADESNPWKLAVYKINSPDNIDYKGKMDLFPTPPGIPAGLGWGSPKDMVIKGNKIYLLMTDIGGGKAALVVIDISNRETPHVDSYNTELGIGDQAPNTWDFFRLALDPDPNIVWAVKGDDSGSIQYPGTIYKINVSNPANPSILNTVTMQYQVSSVTYNSQPSGIAVDDRYIYIPLADGVAVSSSPIKYRRFMVLDKAAPDPANPVYMYLGGGSSAMTSVGQDSKYVYFASRYYFYKLGPKLSLADNTACPDNGCVSWLQQKEYNFNAYILATEDGRAMNGSWDAPNPEGIINFYQTRADTTIVPTVGDIVITRLY